MLRAANLTAKVLLVVLLAHGVLRPDLPQYQGKAMDTRLLAFGLSVVLVPLVWRLLARRRANHSYPHIVDLCVVLPFLMDTAGNALNLYDRIVWFDDAMHLATWIPWVVAFGLGLHYAPALPRWAHFAVVLGFGAVTHILWELGEYVTFIHDSPELATAYTDTLGDLTMSLTGSGVGAALCATVAWRIGRRQAAPG